MYFDVKDTVWILYGPLELLFNKNVPEYVTSALKKGHDVTIDPVSTSSIHHVVKNLDNVMNLGAVLQNDVKTT